MVSWNTLSDPSSNVARISFLPEVTTSTASAVCDMFGRRLAHLESRPRASEGAVWSSIGQRRIPPSPLETATTIVPILFKDGTPQQLGLHLRRPPRVKQTGLSCFQTRTVASAQGAIRMLPSSTQIPMMAPPQVSSVVGGLRARNVSRHASCLSLDRTIVQWRQSIHVVPARKLSSQRDTGIGASAMSPETCLQTTAPWHWVAATSTSLNKRRSTTMLGRVWSVVRVQ